LELVLIPDVERVPKAVIDHTPLAVIAGPDDSKVVVFTVDAVLREVDLARVEAEQHADSVSREVFDLVDLVLEGELAREVPHAGEGRVLDHQGSIEHAPGVAIE